MLQLYCRTFSQYPVKIIFINTTVIHFVAINIFFSAYFAFSSLTKVEVAKIEFTVDQGLDQIN